MTTILLWILGFIVAIILLYIFREYWWVPLKEWIGILTPGGGEDLVKNVVS